MSYRAELVALFGMPVAENPTGVMQEAAFVAAGLNWRYLTIEVPPHALEDAIRGARAFGFRGLNLTIPHKVAVIPLLDDLSAEARVIGAVNTVRRQGEQLIGENTDGKGFLRGLRQEAACHLRGLPAVPLCALRGCPRLRTRDQTTSVARLCKEHLAQRAGRTALKVSDGQLPPCVNKSHIASVLPVLPTNSSVE
jgi:hypothetical protein